MKIYYTSDLHLEFDYIRTELKRELKSFKPESNSILILAGDMNYLTNLQSDSLLKKYCSKFEQVFYVCGNHEFYNNSDASILLEPFEKDFGSFKLVNNIVKNISGVDFVFSSLFSKISPLNEYWISRGMNDFRNIKWKNNVRFNTEHFNEIFENCFEFVNTSVQQSSKCIIVSHHLPSDLLINPYFKGNTLNEAFGTDLTNFIVENTDKIHSWIYGHNHFNQELTIGNTNMLTNQRGYSAKERYNFSFNKFIEI